MKKIFVVLVALFFCGNVFSQGIEFEHGSFEEALAKAKKENKVVFMDCYTTWCGPCKYLAKNIFTQNEVGSFFNKNFVNVKMDMESEAGKPLLKKYKVSAFPTLLWLDSDGNIQHKMVGAGDAKSLIATATTALDPENNWGALNEKFVGGDHSNEFLQKYILFCAKSRFDTKEPAAIYFSGKNSEQLMNAKDAEIIISTVSSTSDSKYLLVLNNKEKFYAFADKLKIDQFLEQTMMMELGQLARKGDVDAITVKKKKLIELDEKIGAKVVSFMNVNMLQRDPDRVKFYQAVVDYAVKYEFDNSENLNRYAWSVAEAKEELSKEILDKALKMAKRSVELDANFANMDTYAFLLNKAGLTKEAKVQAEKSVELAPEDQKESLWANKFLNEVKK
ncbi:MAG: thiol-disulfide isomerase/thioredoxin [bacterium]|jgi:thiol-disulfide isomerase/thioredoxin